MKDKTSPKPKYFVTRRSTLSLTPARILPSSRPWTEPGARWRRTSTIVGRFILAPPPPLCIPQSEVFQRANHWQRRIVLCSFGNSINMKNLVFSNLYLNQCYHRIKAAKLSNIIDVLKFRSREDERTFKIFQQGSHFAARHSLSRLHRH